MPRRVPFATTVRARGRIDDELDEGLVRGMVHRREPVPRAVGPVVAEGEPAPRAVGADHEAVGGLPS